MKKENFYPSSDRYGRRPTYLRLSLTDRCNLNCLYCGNAKKRRFIPHEKILRYEELTRLARIFKSLGTAKIRLTGGEPFARKDCAEFILALRRVFPDLRLSLTTNATLIEPYIDILASCRLDSINVSLDSFDAKTYARLTGANGLSAVLKNIDSLLMRGLRVKINAVALKGETDRQIKDFVDAAKFYGIDARFIELMPMGATEDFLSASFLPVSALIERASSLVALAPETLSDPHAGPAKIYRIKGSRGRLGFISAISSHFCHTCNRLRVTSDGNLRSCLFSEKEYKLAPLLRNPKIADARIANVIKRAAARKPLGVNALAERKMAAPQKRRMVAIGG